MTAQTTTEPPKCCFFNIKTATVALGIFHMVSYRTERGNRESDTRKERQRCNLCRRCNYCRSQGFLTVDFSVFPKEKNQLFKRDGQKKSWHGERGTGRNLLYWEGFLTTFSLALPIGAHGNSLCLLFFPCSLMQELLPMQGCVSLARAQYGYRDLLVRNWAAHWQWKL